MRRCRCRRAAGCSRRRAPGPLPRRARGRCAGDPHPSPGADYRSRARRWQDAVAQLSELQAQYADWLEALPANQHDSALAEALQAICELDLSELESVAPPRGFGRD